MIQVAQQPEPPNFDALVRQPGTRFLAVNPHPTRDEWKGRDYWRHISDQLYSVYKGICAYLGEWFSKPAKSVDHFIPKSVAPTLAYEWGNYRLTSTLINNYKDNDTNIVDPFTVQLGWFVLDLPSCLIKPGTSLSSSIMSMVTNTINVLKLNDNDDLVQNRCNILKEYANGDVAFIFLRNHYPYIAAELERQGAVETVKSMFVLNQTILPSP